MSGLARVEREVAATMDLMGSTTRSRVTLQEGPTPCRPRHRLKTKVQRQPLASDGKSIEIDRRTTVNWATAARLRSPRILEPTGGRVSTAKIQLLILGLRTGPLAVLVGSLSSCASELPRDAASNRRSGCGAADSRVELPLGNEPGVFGVIDPICQMEIDHQVLRRHPKLTVDWEGKVYVFCNVDCAQRFREKVARQQRNLGR